MTVKTLGRAAQTRRISLSESLRVWLHRHRTRRHLLELDERMREDIGLTPAALAEEAAKPFWQA